MVSKWWKVKVALGLNTCLLPPTTTTTRRTSGDELSPPPSERHSDAALLSPVTEVSLQASPPTPVSGGPGLRWSKSLSRSSKKTCSICLSSMKRGDGHAIFTAECSHSFHFHCIASNVKHGNQVCPVCRAKWTEIPLQFPSLDPPPGRARVNPVDWPQQNASMTVVRRLPPPRPNPRQNPTSFQAPEPAVFNDDESLDHQSPSSERNSANKSSSENEPRTMRVKTYTEVPAVQQSSAPDNFAILINLKAPAPTSTSSRDQENPALVSQTSRVPVDLVTVLDVSGSMAGTKLALLKRAMGFVIQNLGPNDRLAVIAFSSTARRLFPLRRMSESGRQQALQAVNLLVANGGTNIAEGLRKGAKVMEDRRYKNPVASIILLSDGQDTYTVSNAVSSQQQPNYQLLLPLSINNEKSSNFKIPVHTFGFGADHDASSMHSISELSGGTFSFIETESVIQDAFAQCIGGLLSVVVKELQVNIECVNSGVILSSLKAGSYPNQVYPDGRMGNIDVGDLYADEERDFLVTVNVPTEISSSETALLKVRCVYNDPLTKELVTVRSEEVRIRRPEVAGQQDASVEVDRQQNRLQAAEAMVLARAAAEKGDLSGAASILEHCRTKLSESVSAKSHDRLCLALEAELKEMQDRLASRHVYEASGRAYILSGLSSHSWQRATARGDSMDGSSLVHAYQTPSMTEMVTRSQATLLGSPSTQRLIRPALSFSSLPTPR
ncbi:OLC1v1026056C1 [Oldenlandia corymbosa var. corymbosa]|uniref:OLC1v1026056C1 n=1 Tax=Oldenlandia corymbosa var. corymbosa TaxID=529605 RepID=A0AAV1C7Z2_OLDCO|nr:OLC1v1026056C1 [Oldenlandia corymbosa var. corymbosa]